MKLIKSTIVFILLVGQFFVLPIFSLAQSNAETLSATLKEDFTIFINNEKQGTLLKNTPFLIQKENEVYYIQWDTGRVEIDSLLLETIQTTTEVPAAYNTEQIKGYVSSTQTLDIADENAVVTGNLEANVKYPVYAESDDSVQVIIGNKVGVIAKTESVSVNPVVVDSPSEEENAPKEESSDVSPVLENTNKTTSPSKTQEISTEEEQTVTQSPSLTPAPRTTFTTQDKYFKPVVDNLGIYDNSSGALVKVAELVNGQVYPRVADSGNWHKIKFGNKYAYVLKSSTVPVEESGLKNLDLGQTNSTVVFKTLDKVPVYDNSNGGLVPFATIEAKQTYPIISTYGDNWYKVSIAGRIGYVYKPLTALPFKTTDRYFKVNTDAVSIYVNEGGKLIEKIGLVKGQAYTRVADYGNWHQVKYGNGYGFVWKDSTIPAASTDIKNLNSIANGTSTFKTITEVPVYDNSSGSLVQFAVLKNDVSYPIIADSGNWYVIDVAGRKGYLNKALVRTSFKSTDTYFKVMEENVKIYDTSSGAFVEVGQLTNGQVYKRTMDYGNWHQIRFGSSFAYVLESATNPDAGNSIKNANTESAFSTKILETLTPVSVYDNSSGALIPFVNLNEKVSLTYLGSSGNWFKVDVAGRIGYIHKSSVKIGYIITAPYLELYSTAYNLKNYTAQDEINLFMNFGERVEVLAEDQYAVQIRSLDRNVTGWVQKDYLDNDLSDNWWYVKEWRTLRAEPKSTSASLGTVDSGASVKVFDYTIGSETTYQGWFKIQTEDGKEGWIWGESANGYNIIRYEKYNMGAETNEINIFTPLNTYSTATVTEINSFIHFMTGGNTASYMYNMGDAYLEAQRQTGINAIYLLAHSALETGFGTSSIVMTKYNYFGIGAFDACPSTCSNAYEGKANGIIEGAKWISANYVNRDVYQQFTLDNMRNNDNKHQYATDEAWAVKIADIAKKFFSFLTGK